MGKISKIISFVLFFMICAYRAESGSTYHYWVHDASLDKYYYYYYDHKYSYQYNYANHAKYTQDDRYDTLFAHYNDAVGGAYSNAVSAYTAFVNVIPDWSTRMNRLNADNDEADSLMSAVEEVQEESDKYFSDIENVQKQNGQYFHNMYLNTFRPVFARWRNLMNTNIANLNNVDSRIKSSVSSNSYAHSVFNTFNVSAVTGNIYGIMWIEQWRKYSDSDSLQMVRMIKECLNKGRVFGFWDNSGIFHPVNNPGMCGIYSCSCENIF